jgi:Bifunctional DNA primase/polymerase, N-terminal
MPGNGRGHRLEQAAASNTPSPVTGFAVDSKPDKTCTVEDCDGRHVARGLCGRCGGPAGPQGAWCDNCIRTCQEHTLRLDLQRFHELNPETLPWAAIFYARAGIPVFPLVRGSKIPHKGSNGVDDATTNLRRIRRWWRDHPNDNIGLATGHRFDVLDIDIKDGRPGRESAARLRIAGHLLGAWGAALTPTGGQHVLYTPSSDGNHVDKPSGLDFRGLGGYIVAAPSRTKDGAYQWEFCDPQARGLPFNWQAAMEHLYGAKPKPEHRTAHSSGIGGLVGFVQKSEPGGRNDALHWAACRAHEKNLPTDELLAAAVARGLPEQEATNTIQSARKTVGLPA